jgi:uncharacterized membrane protein
MALIQQIQGTEPVIRPIPAVLIYILMAIGIVVFAVIPSTEIESAALRGALLGLCMYGVYDLTNYAIFTNYSLEMTLTDMAWGTFLCALGASFAYIIRSYFLRRAYTMFNLSWLKHFKYQYSHRQTEI